METPLFEPAPAKINLFLHVIGKREDGYHRLQSLAVFAGAGEQLTATLSEDLSLTCEGEFAQALGEGQNLVLAAASTLRDSAGIKSAAALSLSKELPVGAGLGGGSADAAACLRLLSRLWKTNADLEALARTLGSDVPACIRSQSVWMEETGHDLRPARLPALDMVLVNPRRMLSTREMYARIKPPYREPITLPEGFSDKAALLDWLQGTGNDFSYPACEAMPEVETMLTALAQLPGCSLARLSGSGPTCFGLFENSPLAARAAEALKEAHSGWWVRAVRTAEGTV